jgi:hypothetical protein
LIRETLHETAAEELVADDAEELLAVVLLDAGAG